MSKNWNTYLRVPFIGDTFIERGGVTRGRRWLDHSRHQLGLEVWAGDLHITVDMDKRAARVLQTALLTLGITFASTVGVEADWTDVAQRIMDHMNHVVNDVDRLMRDRIRV